MGFTGVMVYFVVLAQVKGRFSVVRACGVSRGRYVRSPTSQSQTVSDQDRSGEEARRPAQEPDIGQTRPLRHLNTVVGNGCSHNQQK